MNPVTGEPYNRERAERAARLSKFYRIILMDEAEDMLDPDWDAAEEFLGIMIDMRHYCHTHSKDFGGLIHQSLLLFTEEWAMEKPEVEESKFRTGSLKVKMYGYDVELVHFEEDSEQRNYCHIEHGDFVSSLERLMQYNSLANTHDESELPVELHVVKAIGRWALDNGY